ncbi:hypothetical protein HPP92_002249 [Vanilla planifolia]|uniref:Uncharacterized protein n=1 Tax=Vanilla planifolia TaxID=51239 RepID=A0A835VKF7_VANPL|nr:hypothetical protein HPP92_002249 [Vanilla planifolia]
MSSDLLNSAVANGSASSRMKHGVISGSQASKRMKKGVYMGNTRSSFPDYIVLPETVFSLSEKPVCSLEGHVDDILDLCWSESSQEEEHSLAIKSMGEALEEIEKALLRKAEISLQAFQNWQLREKKLSENGNLSCVRDIETLRQSRTLSWIPSRKETCGRASMRLVGILILDLHRFPDRNCCSLTCSICIGEGKTDPTTDQFYGDDVGDEIIAEIDEMTCDCFINDRKTTYDSQNQKTRRTNEVALYCIAYR